MLSFANAKSFYIKPLIVSLLLISAGVFLKGSHSFLVFVPCWCLFQSFAVLLNIKEQMHFYSWWQSSDLSDAKTRGFGTNGFKLLGFLPMPTLKPQQLYFVSCSYAFGLILCAWFADKNFVGILFLLTTILSLLYFSQLWAERTASYHREYLTIAILFYFCLTPFYGLGHYSPLIIFIIKAHVTSIYMAGALQKIACSFWAKKPWFMSAPHGFLWRAMWSKPYFLKIQQYFFLRPGMLALGSAVVLLLELTFFLNFWMPIKIQWCFALCFILFHSLVFLLQGIDYLTFWCPVFLLWFIAPFDQAITWSLYSPAIFAIIFCGAQIIYAFSFLEDFNINIPPFTCCPMFVNSCTFNEKIPQYYCIWDRRSKIAFERLEWSYPFVKLDCGMGLVLSDLEKLPFKMVGFGFYVEPKKLPKLQQKWFQNDLIKKEGFFIFSNFNIDEKTKDELKEFINWLHEDFNNASMFDQEFLKEVKTRHENCLALIDEKINQTAFEEQGESYDASYQSRTLSENL